MAEASLELIISLQNQAQKGLEAIQAELRGVQDAAEGTGGVLSTALGTFAGGALLSGISAAVNGITSSFGALKDGMIGGNAEFERYETQFGVLLGSADLAKQRLADLAAFGAATPFELPDIVVAEKQLVAFGLAGEDVAARFGKTASEIRTIAGDVAAGTGAGFEEVAGYLGKFAAGSTGEAIARFQELGIVTKQQLSEMGLAFDNAGSLTTPVEDAMDVLLVAMQNKFGGMMTAQSSTFEGMLSNFEDWKAGAMRTLGEPIFDVVKDNLGNLLQFLSSADVQMAISGFAETIASGLGTAIDWLTGTAIPNLQAGWDTIQPSLDAVGAAFGTIGTAIGESGLVEALGSIFEGMNGGVGAADLLAGTIALIADGLNAAAPVIGGVATGVAGLISSFQEGGTGAMVLAEGMAALAPVSDAVSGALGTIGTIIAAATGDFGAFGESMSGIELRINEFVGALSGITTAIGTIGGYIAGQVPQWGAIWGETFGQLQATAQAIFSALLPVITGVLQQITAFLNAHGTEIVYTMTAAWNQVNQIVQTAAQLIQAIVVPALAAVAGFIRAHGAEIQAVLGGAWQIVQSLIIGTLNTIQGLLAAALAAIQGDWQGAWTAIQGVAQAQMQAIQGAISGGIQIIVGLFGGLATQAMAALQSLVTGAATIGNQIIQGIVSGVQNGAGALYSTLAGMASNALSAATSAFQIGSPSRLFADKVGQPIAEGVAAGVTAGGNAVTSAVVQIGADALAAVRNAVGNLGDAWTDAGDGSIEVGEVLDDIREKAAALGVDANPAIQNLMDVLRDAGPASAEFAEALSVFDSETALGAFLGLGDQATAAVALTEEQYAHLLSLQQDYHASQQEIAADAAEQLAEAQQAFDQNRLDSAVDFYDRITSMDDQALAQKLSAEYEAAALEAQQIATDKGADVADAWLEAQQKAIEGQGEIQAKINAALAENDGAEAERLQGILDLQKRADDNRLSQILAAEDSIKTQQAQKLAEQEQQYQEHLSKLGTAAADQVAKLGDLGAAATAAGQSIQAGITPIVTATQATATAASEVLQPALETMAGVFGTQVTDAVSSAGDKLQRADGWFDDIARAVGSATGKVIEWTKKLTEAADNIPEAFEGQSPPPMADWFSYIAESVGDAATGLDTFRQGLVGLTGFDPKIIEQIRDAVESVGDAIQSVNETVAASNVSYARTYEDALKAQQTLIKDTGELAKIDQERTRVLAQQEKLQADLAAAQAKLAAVPGDDPALLALRERSSTLDEVIAKETRIAQLKDEARKLPKEARDARLKELDLLAQQANAEEDIFNKRQKLVDTLNAVLNSTDFEQDIIGEDGTVHQGKQSKLKAAQDALSAFDRDASDKLGSIGGKLQDLDVARSDQRTTLQGQIDTITGKLTGTGGVGEQLRDLDDRTIRAQQQQGRLASLGATFDSLWQQADQTRTAIGATNPEAGAKYYDMRLDQISQSLGLQRQIELAKTDKEKADLTAQLNAMRQRHTRELERFVAETGAPIDPKTGRLIPGAKPAPPEALLDSYDTVAESWAAIVARAETEYRMTLPKRGDKAKSPNTTLRPSEREARYQNYLTNVREANAMATELARLEAAIWNTPAAPHMLQPLPYRGTFDANRQDSHLDMVANQPGGTSGIWFGDGIRWDAEAKKGHAWEPPSYAIGVRGAPGGLAYLHQDELAYLPTGSDVYTASETRRMLRTFADGAGGGDAITIHIDARGAAVGAGREIEAAVRRALADAAATKDRRKRA